MLRRDALKRAPTGAYLSSSGQLAAAVLAVAGMTGSVMKEAWAVLRYTLTLGGGETLGVSELSLSAPTMVTRMRFPAANIFDVGCKSNASSTGVRGSGFTSAAKLR